jgi:hypothetical protein
LGDLAIFAALDTVLDLEAGILGAFPKLDAFYKHIKAIPSITAAVTGIPAYFKRD